MRLVLLFGYMHSGTSILHRIIRSAGNIYAPKKEINFFNYKLPRYRSQFKHPITTEYFDEVVGKLAKDISGSSSHNLNTSGLKEISLVDLYFYVFSHLASAKNYQIIMDGTPNNLFFTSEIKREFQAIGIVRDVRDILSSKKRRSMNSEKDYSIVWDSFSIKKYYKKLRNKSLDNNIHIIRYEDLTKDYFDVVKKIQSFLNISINRSPDSLRFNNSDNINKKGIFRNSGRFREDLSNSEIWISQLICSEILKTYDYSFVAISFNDKLKGILLFFTDMFFPIKRLKRVKASMSFQDFISYLRIQFKKVLI